MTKLDDLLPILLDVFVEAAIDSGLQTRAFETVLDTMVSFSSINLRGKLLSRLRKVGARELEPQAKRLLIPLSHQAIAKTAKAPSTTQLADNPAWVEITTLVRMNMVLSFTNRLEVMLYLPELLHVLLLLVGTGSEALRRAIHGSTINLMHSLCTEDPREIKADSENISPSGVLKVRAQLASFVAQDALDLFGLPTNVLDPFAGSLDVYRNVPSNDQIEALAAKAYQLAEYAAPTVDTANSWRARLTGLITSTAFQYNPFIQSRAFVLLGCLAQGEIDDDLLYQILVSLRGSISEWGNNSNDGPLISILTCLSKVVRILPRRSRYLPQMFWLGVCMLQYGQVSVFHAGVNLLHASLETIWERQLPQEDGIDVPTFLLDARTEFREASCRLDDETGIDFEIDFSFAMAALLVKGLRAAPTRKPTQKLLHALLKYTSQDLEGHPYAKDGKVSVHHLGFFVALLPTAIAAEDFGQLLHLAGMDQSICDEAVNARRQGRWNIFTYFDEVDNKKALLVVTLIAALLEHADTDDEKLLLYTYLGDAAVAKPAIVSIL